jgi:hypothetical protein
MRAMLETGAQPMTRRSLAVAAAVLHFSVSAALAADPVEVLPDAMYATGKGCAVIKKTLPEDVEPFTFHALYNTDLYGPGFACSFTDAAKSGKVTTVKANCQFGAAPKPSTIVIKPGAGKGVTVSMTDAQGKEADLGALAHCGKILAQ